MSSGRSSPISGNLPYVPNPNISFSYARTVPPPSCVPSPPGRQTNSLIPAGGFPVGINPQSSNYIPGDPLHTIQYLNDPNWPRDLKLDQSKSNWEEWYLRLKLICDRQGFSDWLDPKVHPPGPTADRRTQRVWELNNRSIRAFIFTYISCADYKAMANLPSAHKVLADL
jgi:hypothetical protein